MYHVLALLDLRVLRACGLQSEAVTKMEAALRGMTHPDGEIALFNDSWIGEAPPPSDLISPGDVSETATLVETGYTRMGRGGDAVIFDHGPCGPCNSCGGCGPCGPCGRSGGCKARGTV